MNLDRLGGMVLFLGVVAFMFWGCIGIIWGNLAEKNWERWQKSTFWSKERYIKQQRVTAWMILPFMIVFLAILVGLMITQPADFSLRKIFGPKSLQVEARKE
ncbi:hypothetical protein IAD21_04390 [Abditibacteriota bacterium]|nr:hypothetical protein IAD21_04390 [Abditibacteriota bacterium]